MATRGFLAGETIALSFVDVWLLILRAVDISEKTSDAAPDTLWNWLDRDSRMIRYNKVVTANQGFTLNNLDVYISSGNTDAYEPGPDYNLNCTVNSQCGKTSLQHRYFHSFQSPPTYLAWVHHTSISWFGTYLHLCPTHAVWKVRSSGGYWIFSDQSSIKYPPKSSILVYSSTGCSV